MEIWDKKQTENMVANHSSRVNDVDSDDIPINDYFPYDRMIASARVESPCYAHITGFLEANDSGIRKTHEEVASLEK